MQIDMSSIAPYPLKYPVLEVDQLLPSDFIHEMFDGIITV